MPSHAIIKIKKLRAVINGLSFEDVVQYTATWSLNSIPMASILVAVGRNVENGSLATIHHIAKTLKVQLKAEIYLLAEVTDTEKATAGVSDIEIKLFDGKVVGTGWQRTDNGAHFSISLLHWLGDLNNASSMSASLHPGSAGDLAYPAVFAASGAGNKLPETSPLAAWVPDISKSIVNPASFSNIWDNIFLKWLTSLATTDPYDRSQRNANLKGNPDTIAALERMKTNADGQPLELDLHGGDAPTFSVSISNALMDETGNSWINTTMWGKIIGEWAPAYLFSVVPRVDDALVVPFTGGLQGEPWAVIGDEDYNFADINAQLLQVLRSVGIVYPIATSTGYDMNLNTPQVTRSGLMGVFAPDDLESGMILYKDAPKWLSFPKLPHTMSASAEGIFDTAIGTAMDEVDAAGGSAPGSGIDNSIASLSDISSAYAHQLYILESLKGRTGEVAGKLRFDIAPGSNVKVIAGGSKNVPGAKELVEDIYATVVQVSYVINAENQRAGTGFSLAHIRNETENKSKATSVAKPPLYQKAWRGAKLVPAAPGPEPAEQ